jgi:hypothetical protein
MLARASSNLIVSQSGSLQREYDVGVRWSSACNDLSPKAEGLPPLEAVTEQRDGEHWPQCNSDLWGIVTSCISVQ